jgi:hypothetical protein
MMGAELAETDPLVEQHDDPLVLRGSAGLSEDRRFFRGKKSEATLAIVSARGDGSSGSFFSGMVPDSFSGTGRQDRFTKRMWSWMEFLCVVGSPSICPGSLNLRNTLVAIGEVFSRTGPMNRRQFIKSEVIPFTRWSSIPCVDCCSVMTSGSYGASRAPARAQVIELFGLL